MTNNTQKRARKSNKVAVADQTLDAVLDALAVETGAETVAQNVDDAIVSEALDMIANDDNATVITGDTVQTLRDIALAFDQTDVDAMSEKVREAFNGRDAFELARNGEIGLSYQKARKNMIANINAVSRAFLALNIEPVNVIRRKAVSTNEFNAKALDKVTEIAQFICGNTSRFQQVTKAFIACSLLFAQKNNGEAISNKTNTLFLSNASFAKMVSDKELAEYLSDYQHKFMSGGKDTQSSQVRNVLDVLGLGEIVTCERARGGIVVNSDHGFYSLFRDKYMHVA